MDNGMYDLIKDDITNLGQLHNILEQERLALEKNHSQQLTVITEEKTKSLNEIERNHQMRSDLLHSSGYSNNPDGIKSYLDSLTLINADSFKKQWGIMLEKLQSCMEMNDLNGKIIHRSQQQVTHMLSIMRGQVHNPSLYNEYGSTSAKSSFQRAITKA